MALKLRRGTDSQRALITPADGELIYTTDTKKLFVGDGTTQGGNPVDTAGAALGSNLSLNNFDLVGTGNINTTGNITVTGNITADGNLTLGGNLTVGDASSDTLNLTAKVESHILPDVDSARNVGSATLRWNQGYFGSLHITDTLDAGSVNANIIGDDSTVIVNKATGAINASGTFKGDVKATDNTSFFNATSKEINAGAATFTGAVAAPSITAGSITGNFKGTIAGDDSTILVDAVNSTVRLDNGLISINSDTLSALQADFFISSKTAGVPTTMTINDNSAGGSALKIFGKTNSSFDPLTALVFRGFKDNLVTPNAMVAGQYIGKLSFQGYDTGTTNIVESGGIAWRVDPNNSPIGTDTMKGKMEVVTQAGSNSSPDLKYLTFDSQGRLGVNKQTATAVLDVDGDAIFSSTVKFANLTEVQRDALNSVSAGMVIYNTTSNKLQVRTGVSWVDLH